MSETPQWLTEQPRFIASLAWLPIVCTGRPYADARMTHDTELLGALQNLADARTGELTPCIIRRPKDSDSCYIEISHTDQRPRFVHEVLTAGMLAPASFGSIVITCPSCKRAPRMQRWSFMRWLQHAETAGLPWADVSLLD